MGGIVAPKYYLMVSNTSIHSDAPQLSPAGGARGWSERCGGRHHQVGSADHVISSFYEDDGVVNGWKGVQMVTSGASFFLSNRRPFLVQLGS